MSSQTAPAPEATLGHMRRGVAGVVGSSELFLPLDEAEWKRGKVRLDRDARRAARSSVSGVRFHAADPAGENLEPERLCQRDVVGLVDGLQAVRSQPGLEDVVLGKRAQLARRPRDEAGRRARFGLEQGGSIGADDVRAARVNHRRIRRAIARSGFVVLEPKRFDAATGMNGLREWGDQLRLGKRRPWWPWLLLLLPLLFLNDCAQAPEAPAEPPSDFFGIEIEHKSLLVLIDVSGSMRQHFDQVRAEGHRLIDEWVAGGGSRFADIIVYDAQARSALGGIQPLTPENATRLKTFLDQLAVGGGTRLRSGLDLAAEEVAAHGKPTTLVMLTDAQDGSIEPTISEFENLRGAFGGIGFRGHGLTPRLFGGGGDAQPQDENERRFAELADLLGGRFGAGEKQP